MQVDLPVSNREDCLIWMGNNNGKFTVRSCHLPPPTHDATNRIWDILWKGPLHERLKVFCWRLASDALPTKSILQQRMGIKEATCWLCGQQDESSLHLFKNCSFTCAVAFAGKWGIRLDGFNCELVKDLICWCLGGGRNADFDTLKDTKTLIFASLFYVIWNARNGKLFDKNYDVALVVKLWERMVDDFAGESHIISQESRTLKTKDRWKPPGCPC